MTPDNVGVLIAMKDIDGAGFVNIATGQRDPNNKPIENGIEVRTYLDQSVLARSTYTYQLLFESLNGRNSTLSDRTTPILIPNESGFTFKSEGKVLQTTRILIPYSQVVPTIFIPSFEINSQNAYAETTGLQPLVISSLNPKNEPYLFSLDPVPSPLVGAECKQILELLYSRSADGGQDLTVFATVVENQATVRIQHLYDNIEISDVSQIFNFWHAVPLSQQTIQDYSNLEVQLDISSSTTLNPLDYRSLSIYGINLYVSESNQVCS